MLQPEYVGRPLMPGALPGMHAREVAVTAPEFVSDRVLHDPVPPRPHGLDSGLSCQSVGWAPRRALSASWVPTLRSWSATEGWPTHDDAPGPSTTRTSLWSRDLLHQAPRGAPAVGGGPDGSQPFLLLSAPLRRQDLPDPALWHPVVDRIGRPARSGRDHSPRSRAGVQQPEHLPPANVPDARALRVLEGSGFDL